MTKKREIYHCPICGNVVEVMSEGGGVLVCCGKPMVKLPGNTTEASQEKHIPVIEKIEGGYKVTVGSISHPMTAADYIQWIVLETPTHVLRCELQPSDEPQAIFMTNEAAVCALSYCNLHGLWRKK